VAWRYSVDDRTHDARMHHSSISSKWRSDGRMFIWLESVMPLCNNAEAIIVWKALEINVLPCHVMLRNVTMLALPGLQVGRLQEAINWGAVVTKMLSWTF
jgi:hypothetical protein